MPVPLRDATLPRTLFGECGTSPHTSWVLDTRAAHIPSAHTCWNRHGNRTPLGASSQLSLTGRWQNHWKWTLQTNPSMGPGLPHLSVSHAGLSAQLCAGQIVKDAVDKPSTQARDLVGCTVRLCQRTLTVLCACVAAGERIDNSRVLCFLFSSSFFGVCVLVVCVNDSMFSLFV